MPPPRNNTPNAKAEVAQRRTRVAEYYLKGMTQVEIARICGVSQSQISLDLKAIQEMWKERYTRDYNSRVEEELARLDYLEKLAHEGYQRSLMNQTATKVRTEKVPTKSSKVPKLQKGAKPTPIERTLKTVTETATRTMAGDPRFLQILSDIVDKRLRILGALSNTGVQMSQTLQINWDEMALSPPSQGANANVLEHIPDNRGGVLVPNQLPYREEDPIEKKINEVANMQVPRVEVDIPYPPTPLSRRGREDDICRGQSAHNSSSADNTPAPSNNGVAKTRIPGNNGLDDEDEGGFDA